MSALVLLTADDCHLCEHGKAVLDGLGLAFRVVDEASDEGRGLAAGTPPLRPVLLTADGRVVAYGRLSSKRLQKRLAPRPRAA